MAPFQTKQPQAIASSHVQRTASSQPHRGHAGLAEHRKELRQLKRAAGKPVRVIHQHRITKAGRQNDQLPLIGQAALPRERRHIVVDLPGPAAVVGPFGGGARASGPLVPATRTEHHIPE